MHIHEKITKMRQKIIDSKTEKNTTTSKMNYKTKLIVMPTLHTIKKVLYKLSVAVVENESNVTCGRLLQAKNMYQSHHGRG